MNNTRRLQTQKERRQIEFPFFSPDSFWNTPLPDVTKPDERSEQVIKLFCESYGRGFHINLSSWTIPVYYATGDTPRIAVHRKIEACPISVGFTKASAPYLKKGHPRGHFPNFGSSVPMPAETVQDDAEDGHLCIIDLEAGLVYDMWQAGRMPDGRWATNSGICYPIDGSGVFEGEYFTQIHDDESIHYYGPCRASGVPLLGGLIMRDEVLSGKIEHKLAFACEWPALKQFVSPPAIWTDGWHPGGMPQGGIIRLNPELDLSTFNLPDAARTVARALQKYGAVCLDMAGGITLYGEGIFNPDRPAWNGLLGEDDLAAIGFEHFHLVEMPALQSGGSHPIYHPGMSRRFYDVMMDGYNERREDAEFLYAQYS